MMNTIDLIRLQEDLMTVPEMRKLLGLGKTDSYWLLKNRPIETVTIRRHIYVVRSSFEEWYDRQVKYQKTDGTPPGRLLSETSYSVREITELLNISDCTVYELIHRGKLETFEVDHVLRVTKESFDRWYSTQSIFRKREDRERDEQLREQSWSYRELGRLLRIPRSSAWVLLNDHKDQFTWVEAAGQMRVTKESFEAWLQARGVPVPKEPQPEPEPEIKEHYRMEEFIRLTGINRRRLVKMIQTGELDALKIGQGYIIPGTEYERLKRGE